MKKKNTELEFPGMERFLLRSLLFYYIGQFDTEIRMLKAEHLDCEKVVAKRYAAESILLALGQLHFKIDTFSKKFLAEEIAPLCNPLSEREKNINLLYQTGIEFILSNIEDETIKSLGNKLTGILNK